MFRACFKAVSGKFKWCIKIVLKVLPGCFKLQVWLKKVLRLFWRCFHDVWGKLHGYFFSVWKTFHGCFKAIFFCNSVVEWQSTTELQLPRLSSFRDHLHLNSMSCVTFFLAILAELGFLLLAVPNVCMEMSVIFFSYFPYWVAQQESPSGPQWFRRRSGCFSCSLQSHTSSHWYHPPSPAAPGSVPVSLH